MEVKGDSDSSDFEPPKEEVRGIKGERGKIPHFKTIELAELGHLVEDSAEQGQYLFISDMSGQAATFFKYSGPLVSQFHGECKKVIVEKSQTKKEAAAALRKDLLHTMRHGRTCVINLDTMICPLKSEYQYPHVLPLEKLIFDRPRLLSRFKFLIKKEEDFNMLEEKGKFEIRDKFNIIILKNSRNKDCDDHFV